MKKRELVFSVSMVALLSVLPMLGGCGGSTAEPTGIQEPETGKKVIYVGGSFALTGAYAEDCAAVLAAYEDYVKYVNDTKKLAPWREETWPEDITVELVWRDDELKVDKTISIFEELKAKGMLVQRVSGSPQALALMQSLSRANIAATSQATGSYLLTPPETIFTYYPIYTDDLAAIADWFMGNWTEDRKPRVAYLTADNAFGRSIEIPEMTDYLRDIGFEFVGSQYVPLVPASPPTTQLLWLKRMNVDLALGAMVNPGSQPTIKEATRLGMGPDLEYKMTFGFAAPAHLTIFVRDMGTLGNGVVVGGSFPPLDDLSIEGIAFCDYLQTTYRGARQDINIMYVGGVLEAMIQVEAFRLAMQTVPYEELTAKDVLEKGFYQINNMETGLLSCTPIDYGEGDIEGVEEVRLDIVVDGEVKFIGNYPCRHIIDTSLFN
jgi:hypothetical protein